MTKLSPMEETLFQAWARAHRIDDHDDPKNIFDYRKIYKDTNGQIHPPGMLTSMAAAANGAVGEAQTAQGGDAIDPAMAAVEHQKNQADSQNKAADRDHKAKLNKENNMTKILLKKMELDHKGQMAEQDRAHKQQEAQMQHELSMRQAEQDRVARMQEVQVGHQHEMERAQMGFQHDDAQAMAGRQHELETARMGHQAEASNSMLQEQLARSRPQQTNPMDTLGGQMLRREVGSASPREQMHPVGQ